MRLKEDNECIIVPTMTILQLISDTCYYLNDFHLGQQTIQAQPFEPFNLTHYLLSHLFELIFFRTFHFKLLVRRISI